MFTQGMVARLNRHTNADTDSHGHLTGTPSRAVLLLNITAEFAPGERRARGRFVREPGGTGR